MKVPAPVGGVDVPVPEYVKVTAVNESEYASPLVVMLGVTVAPKLIPMLLAVIVKLF